MFNINAEFEKGDKVICQSSIFDVVAAIAGLKDLKNPVEGQEYTVREFGVTNGNPWVLLEEIDNKGVHPEKMCPGVDEHVFGAGLFKKVDRNDVKTVDVAACALKNLKKHE